MNYLWCFLLSLWVLSCSGSEKSDLKVVEDYSFLHKQNKTLVLANLELMFLQNEYTLKVPPALHNAFVHYNYETSFIEKLTQVLYQHDKHSTFHIDVHNSLEEQNIRYQSFIRKQYPQEVHSYTLIIEVEMKIFLLAGLDHVTVTQQANMRLLNPQTNYVYLSQEKLSSYNFAHLSLFHSNTVLLEVALANRVNSSAKELASFLLKLD